MTYRMVVGQPKGKRLDLKGLVHTALYLVGTFNIADFLLIVTGINSALKETKLDEALEKIVQDHEKDLNAKKEQQQEDFVDILLTYMNQPVNRQDESAIGRNHIKAIIFDMFAGALDSSANVVSWALSELMRHPRIMNKLQDELEQRVGLTRPVEESDSPHPDYLDMVVKEILRLCPIDPLILPRESTEDITVDGYFIKKKSRFLVNVWAIGRDPKVWSDNVDTF